MPSHTCELLRSHKKRKNQSKYDRTGVAALIFMFMSPITLLRHILIPNQSAPWNYCLINSVINSLTALLCLVFILRVFKIKTMRRTVDFTFLSNKGEIFFLPKGICSSKRVYVQVKTKTKFYKKLSEEFNREQFLQIAFHKIECIHKIPKISKRFKI